MVLRELLRGKAADWIVYFLQNIFSFLQSTFGIGFVRAADIYQYAIRNNLDYILTAAIIICFVILARYLISQFSKYFSEINSGLDMLVEDRGGEIKAFGEKNYTNSGEGKRL